MKTIIEETVNPEIMADNMVHFTVENPDGTRIALEAPTDMGLSLMEFLKASDYNILATCGGMALCATCCIDVLKGGEKLPELNDAEEGMLDTLPDSQPESRLACQLKISNEMEGMIIKLHSI